ncbi:MAG: hypothetical protein AAGC47_12325 [Bacteroidota bacterium]
MNKLQYIVFCLLFLCVFSSCEEVFEEENGARVEQYFEGKVDGERFEGYSDDEQCNQLVFAYFPEAVSDLAPGYLEMGARNCFSSSRLNFIFQGVEPEYTGTTSLLDLDFADSFRPSYRSADGVSFNRIVDGSFSVNSFSGSNKKQAGRLSGSFEMRLTSLENTDTIHITDGKFSFPIPKRID